MPIDRLRRYTSLPILLSYLQERRVTLVSPRRWPDKNDTYYLERFKERSKLTSLLALCFTESDETASHWIASAPGSTGVCIRYHREAFLEAVGQVKGVQARKVIYKTVRHAEGKGFKVADLPFLKRVQYKNEKEFRLIYSSRSRELEVKHVRIPIAAIDRIYLSPLLDDGLVESVTATIKGIKGCGGLKVYRSTLTSNAAWKGAADNAR